MKPSLVSNLKFAAVLALIPTVVLTITLLRGSASPPAVRMMEGILAGWIAAALAIAIVPEVLPRLFPPDATYRMKIACPECGHKNDVFKRGCPGSKCTTVNNRWIYHPIDAVLVFGFVVFLMAYTVAIA